MIMKCRSSSFLSCGSYPLHGNQHWCLPPLLFPQQTRDAPTPVRPGFLRCGIRTHNFQLKRLVLCQIELPVRVIDAGVEPASSVP